MLDDDVRMQLDEWAARRQCPHCRRQGLCIEWRSNGVGEKPALTCPACDFEATAS